MPARLFVIGPAAVFFCGAAFAEPPFPADTAQFGVRAPGPAPVGPAAARAPAYLDEWSGVYVGIAGGINPAPQGRGAAVTGFVGAAGLGRLPAGSRGLPPLSAVGAGTARGGPLLGGAIGVQKQLGGFVLGLEADAETGFGRSSVSSAVQSGTGVMSQGFQAAGGSRR